MASTWGDCGGWSQDCEHTFYQFMWVSRFYPLGTLALFIITNIISLSNSNVFFYLVLEIIEYENHINTMNRWNVKIKILCSLRYSKSAVKHFIAILNIYEFWFLVNHKNNFTGNKVGTQTFLIKIWDNFFIYFSKFTTSQKI